ncbi:MAG: hypothetical protein ACYTGZ_03330 [Planctomycetota bacterium]|jgi:hypothetical protein
MTACLVACSGGATAPGALQETPDAPVSDPDPAPLPTPQQPAVDAEVIGMPGAAIPGLDAIYVSVLPGWIAPDGSVIFDAIVQWNRTKTLGCGILRRAPDGQVNSLLMQEQSLAGTGGGKVKHPKLPLEARGDTLVMAADIVGGLYDHGLFAVHKDGGDPVLLAVENEGKFIGATMTADGSVIAEVERATGNAVMLAKEGAPTETLCTHCKPGFSTDGTCVVVRHDDAAWMIEFDGSTERIAGIGDAAPHGGGTVTGVRGAWINDASAFVVHLDTDATEHPDMLVRLANPDASPQVLAACGAQAPGIAGRIETIHVAEGRSRDVVFGARIARDGIVRAAIFCARPEEAPMPLVETGERVDGDRIAILEEHIVSDRAGQVAFGGVSFDDNGLVLAEGVFRIAPGKAPERVLSTDAEVLGTGGAQLRAFAYPLRQAMDVAENGATLVHAGLVEARRPEATLGALLLVR